MTAVGFAVALTAVASVALPVGASDVQSQKVFDFSKGADGWNTYNYQSRIFWSCHGFHEECSPGDAEGGACRGQSPSQWR